MALLVSLQTLVKIYDVTERAIQQWTERFEKNDIKVRHDRNEYDLIEFAKARHQEMKEELERVRSDKPSDRLADVNAEFKRLQLEKELGNLLIKADVGQAWSNELSMIIANIDGLYAKLVLLLNGQQKEALQKEITNLKNRIAGSTLKIQDDI